MFDFQYEKTILIPSTVKDGKIIQSNGKPLPRIKEGAIVELTLNLSSMDENPEETIEIMLDLALEYENLQDFNGAILVLQNLLLA